jgi:hypothetical protein
MTYLWTYRSSMVGQALTNRWRTGKEINIFSPAGNSPTIGDQTTAGLTTCVSRSARGL